MQTNLNVLYLKQQAKRVKMVYSYDVYKYKTIFTQTQTQPQQYYALSCEPNTILFSETTGY